MFQSIFFALNYKKDIVELFEKKMYKNIQEEKQKDDLFFNLLINIFN